MPEHVAPGSSTSQDIITSTYTPDVRQLLLPPGPVERPGQGFWTQSSGFRPADVLSRQAMRGTFSLQNVLSTTHENTSEMASQKALKEDPVNRGVLNLHIAISLFEGFMKHLNPFVSQLDPYLHSFDYVRETSTFLFVAILAAASKSLHDSLYHTLYSHAESLLVESFRYGWKSVDVIQAILILTYWKRPDDSRAWLSVGYAIRMAIELGWHKLGTGDTTKPPNMPQIEARKLRNISRTWLVLFVYDRRCVMSIAQSLYKSTNIQTA
jgi:hypothetical protein